MLRPTSAGCYPGCRPRSTSRSSRSCSTSAARSPSTRATCLSSRVSRSAGFSRSCTASCSSQTPARGVRPRRRPGRRRVGEARRQRGRARDREDGGAADRRRPRRLRSGADGLTPGSESQARSKGLEPAAALAARGQHDRQEREHQQERGERETLHARSTPPRPRGQTRTRRLRPSGQPGMADSVPGTRTVPSSRPSRAQWPRVQPLRREPRRAADAAARDRLAHRSAARVPHPPAAEGGGARARRRDRGGEGARPLLPGVRQPDRGGALRDLHRPRGATTR